MLRKRSVSTRSRRNRKRKAPARIGMRDRKTQRNRPLSTHVRGRKREHKAASASISNRRPSWKGRATFRPRIFSGQTFSGVEWHVIHGEAVAALSLIGPETVDCV